MDTIVVPVKKDGFQRVFIGEKCWYGVRIAASMLEKIKYVAAYQTQPVSAITHYAVVDRIEPFDGKYKIIFSGKVNIIDPIPYADARPGTMQVPRYTNFEKLSAAKKLNDLFL